VDEHDDDITVTVVDSATPADSDDGAQDADASAASPDGEDSQEGDASVESAEEPAT
jgi:hypothetical protein